MQNMMRSLGLEVTDKWIMKIFKEIYKNDNHLISQKEFLNWFAKFRTPKDDDVEADLKAAFMVFDKDKNGYITRDELKSAMMIIDEPINDHDLDELLQTTDHDKDGKINYEEFIKTLL
ncbi:hypothetical protein NH340_JMT01626 [Sarcoptes scabiei]|nr:Calmodulin-like protein 1 [Sarcoptes scabiei]UXI15683.1 hypothetical protein NH340_JMT01626 [Sarcoptes scabiei]